VSRPGTYIHAPEPEVVRKLDALARKNGESVARAAGRLLASRLGRDFVIERRQKRFEGYVPARRFAGSPHLIHICVPKNLAAPLRTAARANGLPFATMAGMLIYGALGMRWSKPPRCRHSLPLTDKERKALHAERQRRRWEEHKDEIVARRKKIEAALTEEQRQHRKEIRKRIDARYRARKRIRKLQAAEEARRALLRPAGW